MTTKTHSWARHSCLALFFWAGLALGGCSTNLFQLPAERADSLASRHGWTKHVFRAGHFDLTGFARTAGRSDRLAVYIEGDGLAWLSRTQLSKDPTPAQPYVLELAVRHPPGPVLYVARPCQYTVRKPARGCHPRFWSTDRYAPEVVASVSSAIDQMKAATGARRLILIGYSGGGVVAALLAARRTDVDELVTLAANLDHDTWTRLDRMTPLSGSLNPIDFTEVLEKIPQRHYVGSEDDVVPGAVVESYVRRMRDPSRTRIAILQGFDHVCCWIDNWPSLLAQ